MRKDLAARWGWRSRKAKLNMLRSRPVKFRAVFSFEVFADRFAFSFGWWCYSFALWVAALDFPADVAFLCSHEVEEVLCCGEFVGDFPGVGVDEVGEAVPVAGLDRLVVDVVLCVYDHFV